MKRTILITAGPTREHLDPVRFISNESTGYLGNELARAARKHGCKVIVISGNRELKALAGIEYIYIESARDLEKAVHAHIKKADVLFMTSAVCDFRPAKVALRKIKRSGEKSLVVRLRPNNDILKGLAMRRIKRGRIFVGFCIETNDLVKHAREKLLSKQLDLIVATYYSKRKVPFGRTVMSPVIIKKDGPTVRMRDVPKRKLAEYLVRAVLQ
jgi:phosphopantothenoylcysteine decarboxylase / phosphopantothenate---cysteine ligase